MVERIDNISTRFFKSLYQLAGLTYNDATFNQHSLESRAIVNQFVYGPLTKDQQLQIDQRSKTHRMQIPPPLDSMIDLSFVQDRVSVVLDQISEGKSFDELCDLYPTGDPVSFEEFNALVSKLVKSNGK